MSKSKRSLSLWLIGTASAFILSLSIIHPLAVSAQFSPEGQRGLDTIGETAYENSEPRDVRLIVADVIRTILSLLGFILVVLVIYAGILWMTAAGNEKQVQKAKDIISRAVVGLVIILVAYAITAFVIAQLVVATS